MNDEPGDTLNANEFWKAIVRDYYLGKGGYAYIHRQGGEVVSLHYVQEQEISVLKSPDPIFKDFDLEVGGTRYQPYNFLKVLRNTVDGATGVPLTMESSKLIETAYAALVFERNAVRRGGCKRGFLKSEKRLDEEALSRLRSAFARLYGDSESNENFVVLNNGIDFKEASSTSVELQLNVNKRTNAGEFAKLFHVSADCISGKASEQDVASIARLAAIPLMTTIQCALNKDLLLESEKGQLYFAFDTKELLRGDLQSRFAAYKTALDANFMQIDEVRYAEDMEPLGLDWIWLGLQDVLYDPKTREVFTPNTGTRQQLNGPAGENTVEEGLPDAAEADILEERGRYYKRDEKGRFAGGGGGGGGSKLPDIPIGRSLGAKSKNYIVTDKATGEKYHFVEGTRLQNVQVFAGKGGTKPLKEEVSQGLASEFGGNPEDWQHCKAKGWLDVNNEHIKAEVHWFQNNGKKVKFKVKEWLYDED